MACFIVPAAEAVVTKVVEVVEEKRETAAEASGIHHADTRILLSRKLSWLTWMLTGGAVLLMFEHVWHGEVVPYFPFLTAMYSPDATSEMLHEMATVGVTMAVLVTAVWAGVCAAADAILRRRAEGGEEA